MLSIAVSVVFTTTRSGRRKLKKQPAHPITIEQRIRALLPQLTPGEKRAARALLAAYPIAALGTIAELTALSDASAPTILRLTAKLGFDGYSHFQRAVRAEVQEKMQSPLSLMDSAPRVPTAKSGFFGGFINDITAALQRTQRLLDNDVLEDAIATLADTSKRIHALGGRSSHVLAKHLVFHLHQLRPSVHEIAAGSVPVYHQAADMGRSSVIVAFDFRRYERQSIDFCQQAAREGARIILVTDPWLSPIAEVAQWVLPVEVDVPSPFDSSLAAMAVVEAMLAGTLARLGPTARERMLRLEQGAGIDKVIGSAENTAGEKAPQKNNRQKKPQQRRPSR
ncbi:MurR/RpiR family transcriptional regulator [Dongia rigui]|uniref:MurR/RpiR family transcriptional regulator n=1 Tax=Dongia rigui TaxID=940149 RepID=A0ABU5E201_9PROT|nr:MurR/RpiR family transcriptional regulator [Dongia rigui]MDY0873576.1 MurR/RpiR family transcriptional regulator [Dongia rigui]